MRRSPFLSVLAVAALAYGCSLINKPDELLEKVGSDESGGATGSGGLGGGAGDSGSGGIGEGGGGTGGGSPGTGGSSAVAPTTGLVVLGGTDPSDGSSILSVLDPETGDELKRETLPDGVRAVAIAHDGALGVDNWYIFTSSTFPAPEDVPANLQIRHFDDETNKWTTLDTVTNVPPPVSSSLAVLNGRLAYISHVIEDGIAVPSVTLLDTSDPKAVELVSFDSPHPATGEKFLGLLGVRGSNEDPTLPGGNLNLVIESSCVDTTGCDLVVQPIGVGSLIQPGVRTTLGQYDVDGRAAFATDQLSRDTVFALPPAVTGNVGLIRVDDARSPDENTSVSTPVSAKDLSGMVVAECSELVGFSLLSGKVSVFSKAGVQKSITLDHPGQLLAFEPFTSSLISTYGSNGDPVFPESEIRAFTIGSNSSGTSVTLTDRDASSWTAPADLSADVLAVRAPIPVSCPE